MSRPFLTLLLLCSCTFLAGLGRQAVTDADEAYYAEASREMVESGDWLTPRFNYTDRWEKPVLYYWLTAATYEAVGTSEWAARLWSALSGFGLAFLTWAAARRTGQRADAAWLAGAMAATSFGYMSMARQALPDLPLAFCITLGVWAALTAVDTQTPTRAAFGWWALAGLAAGAGFLMKGPVALVVPGVVLVPVWWFERARQRPSLQGLAAAACVCLLIGLPWYIGMWVTHGTAYLNSFFVGDNLERFGTSRFNDARSMLFYLPILLGGLVPWSAYLATLPARRVPVLAPHAPRLDLWERRLVLWAAMPLLFFTLSVGKQPRYILPVLPPLALLLAGSLSSRIQQAGRMPDVRLRWATWATAVLLAAGSAALLRMRPLLVSAVPLWAIAGATLLGVCALALAWIAESRRWGLLTRLLPASAVVLTFAVQLGALSGVRPEPVEQIAALVRTNRASQEPVGLYGVFSRNLVFYTGVPQTPIFDQAQAVAFLRSAERVLLVTDTRRLPALMRDTGLELRVIGETRYLNAANVRLRTVLAPGSDDALVTAVLVANR